MTDAELAGPAAGHRRRIIIRSTALVVLLLCTLATLWLQQRQLAIRRTLHQVKLLAHDILASMDQGVITTDQQPRDHEHQRGRDPDPGRRGRVRRPAAGEHLAGGVPLVDAGRPVAERQAAVWDQRLRRRPRRPGAAAPGRCARPEGPDRQGASAASSSCAT